MGFFEMLNRWQCAALLVARSEALALIASAASVECERRR